MWHKVADEDFPDRPKEAFHGIDAYEKRSNSTLSKTAEIKVKSEAEAGRGSTFMLLEPCINPKRPVQHKVVLQRYLDSLLTKTNKLRSLMKDLRKNYATDAGHKWLPRINSPHGFGLSCMS